VGKCPGDKLGTTTMVPAGPVVDVAFEGNGELIKESARDVELAAPSWPPEAPQVARVAAGVKDEVLPVKVKRLLVRPEALPKLTVAGRLEPVAVETADPEAVPKTDTVSLKEVTSPELEAGLGDPPVLVSRLGTPGFVREVSFRVREVEVALGMELGAVSAARELVFLEADTGDRGSVADVRVELEFETLPTVSSEDVVSGDVKVRLPLLEVVKAGSYPGQRRWV